MAETIVKATRPVIGQNPYFVFTRSGIIGTDSVKIVAGKTLEVDNIWRPIHLAMQVTTDATVANRNMRMRHGVIGASFKSLQSVDVAASLTKKMLVSGLGEWSATDVGLDSHYDIPLIQDDALVIFGDQGYIQFDINNGQAGDLWIVWFIFKYMNHELGMKDPYSREYTYPEKFN